MARGRDHVLDHALSGGQAVCKEQSRLSIQGQIIQTPACAKLCCMELHHRDFLLGLSGLLHQAGIARAISLLAVDEHYARGFRSTSTRTQCLVCRAERQGVQVLSHA